MAKRLDRVIDKGEILSTSVRGTYCIHWGILLYAHKRTGPTKAPLDDSRVINRGRNFAYAGGLRED